MIAFFDIETNGLYFDVTKAHCMVIILDDNGVLTTKKYRPNEVQKGAQELRSVLHKGGYIVGHNIINYDIPVLEKLFPDFVLVYSCPAGVASGLLPDFPSGHGL